MSKEKKSRKKSSALPFILILLFLFVVALLFWKSGLFGFGGGNGIGFGESSKPVMAEIPVDESSEIVADEIQYVDILVSGSDYIFNSKKMTSDEITAEINSSEDDFMVRIVDDNASKKAYDELINALKDNDIKYIEQEQTD
ncbi:MAG: hypothetical protein K2K91_02770 [Ruminococcus sp.]|nr:hypothetical protein [Ruminococcus sp.]MDE7099092.1 hypothetical protein [Ruminococcus sp.]